MSTNTRRTHITRRSLDEQISIKRIILLALALALDPFSLSFSLSCLFGFLSYLSLSTWCCFVLWWCKGWSLIAAGTVPYRGVAWRTEAWSSSCFPWCRCRFMFMSSLLLQSPVANRQSVRCGLPLCQFVFVGFPLFSLLSFFSFRLYFTYDVN